MTPILGILASQITGHLVTNSYESISTVTVGAGGQLAVSFTSIPQTYKHLQVRALIRSSRSATTDFYSMQFNSDTNANNYSSHSLNGDGASASAGGNANNYYFIGDFPAASATSGLFGVAIIDILDYTNTNKNKTSRALDGYDANGSGQIHLHSQAWYSTSAITSISFQDYSLYNNNFAQGTQFALYGIKG